MSERFGYVLGQCDPNMNHFYKREEPNHDRCKGTLSTRFFCTCRCHKPKKKFKRKAYL